MKASDLFIKCLENEGIEYIFGVPGEENADFMISLEEAGTVKFILTRHEQGAAFMAEIYGRLTGKPAGCLGTLGPGATNLITGVADSNMDRAPMLVLTGQGSSDRLHKESHQVMDVVGMFKPVTKWAQMVFHPDNIPEIVRKAVRIATTEKPGACLIELPEDIAKMQTTVPPIEVRQFRRPVADDKIVNEAWEAIVSAKRPIILAGNGCIRRRAAGQLRKFANATGIGVLNTMMAKGCVDMDDEQCCYTIGLGGKDVPAVAIDQADLVISLGYDMVEYHPRLWNPHGTKRVIHADFIPSEVDENYRIEVEIVGDLAHTVWMLNERLEAHGAENLDFDHGHTRLCREKMTEEFEADKDDDAVGKIKPQKALWDARQVLDGPNDILLSDVGAHKMWIARYFQCHEPNTCLIPNGFCSMGFSLPGAIAAHFVDPNRKVLGICGDAGFLMNVQEMETAKRYNSNITMLIWEDNAYGLIAWKQYNQFGKHTDLSFGNPEFVLLAECFGWNGYRCEDSSKLQDTLRASFDAEGPSLIVIPIDYAENNKLTKRMGELTASL